MESKHLFLAALYLGPFLIPVFMPGWRSLSIISAGGIVFGVWLFVFKASESGGLSLSVERALYAMVFWGLAAGIITRVITLALAQRALPLWVVSLIVVAGALVPPAIIFFAEK